MQVGHEIKFQVWDQDAKQMWSWEDIKKADQEGILRFLDMLEQDQFIPRRFTGRRDKNGKEIYEGDIVRKIDFGYAKRSDIYGLDFDEWLKVNNVLSYEIEDDDFVKYYYVTLVDVVVMDRFPRFWLKSESFGYEGEDLVEPSDCEVIGNIYENPELLQAG